MTLKYILLLCGLLLFVLNECTGNGNIAGGSSSESGNARVNGMLTDAQGTPQPNTVVRLVPVDLMANDTTARNRIQTDTSRSNGEYQFDNVPFGHYNIEAISAQFSTSGFRSNLEINKPQIHSAPVIIRKSLPLIITVPHPSTLPSSVFLRGTTIMADSVITTDSALIFVFNAVPSQHPLTVTFVADDSSIKNTDIAPVNEESSGDSVVISIGATDDPLRLITIDTRNISTVQDESFVTSFPLLVRFTPDSLMSPEGIHFIDNNNTILPFEIEEWPTKSSATASIWVLLDTLHIGNIESIRIVNGIPNGIDSSIQRKVFDFSNGFAGVWHFSASNILYSSNGYSFSGTDMGTSSATGIAGQGRLFDGSGYMRIDDTEILSPEELTISCWIKKTVTQNIWAKFISKGESSFPFNSYSLEMRNEDGVEKAGAHVAMTDNSYRVTLTSTPIPDSSWSYLAFTYNSITGRGSLFHNGALVDSIVNGTSIQYYTYGKFPLYFGVDRQIEQDTPASIPFFKGILDEISICNKVRSPLWITLSYLTQRQNGIVKVY